MFRLRVYLTITAQIYCFGVPITSSNVCGGNGTCTAQDTCACTSGYNLPNCDTWSCNSILMNNPSVCSGNGSCTSPNVCTCNVGYTGASCNSYKCFGNDL